LRVLLIEDSPADAQVIRDLLSGLPELTVEHVHTLEALTQRQGHAPDVVLLDLSLTSSSGLETVRRARAAMSEVPVVALTAERDERLVLDVLEEGAEDCLVKAALCSDLLLRSLRYSVERYGRSRLMGLESVAKLAAGGPAAESDLAATRTGMARILLVDDEPSILKIFRAGLIARHAVDTCESGESALLLLRSDSHYDLVICDYTMPGMNGVELLLKVSEFAPELAARFIFCTGAPLSDAATATLAEKESKFLYKPVRPTVLLDAVNLRLNELRGIASGVL
jgi:CheY-like chemotaxis protein